MRILLSFLLLMGVFVSHGQITAEKSAHDFGDLYPNATTYVDIEFTNKTDKKHYLLTVDKPRDVYYIFSSKVLLPDSAITIRFKINDGRRGKFSHDIDLYFSDSNNPISVKLTGNVKEVSANPLTACPDFNSSPPTSTTSYEFAITIKVIDSLTREPIHRAKVSLVQNNRLVAAYYTNRDGIVHKEVPMGYYLIATQEETYYDNYKEAYLNFQRNYVEVELQQPIVEAEPDIIVMNEPEEEQESEIVITFTEKEPIVEEEPIIEEEEVVEIPTPVIEVPVYIDTTALADLPDSVFDIGHFKLNNITFILDVSSSMNSVGKLELLKLSMTELVKVLRDDDLITILKYSSTVDVVVEGMHGKDKEEITERVAELRTSSSTAGGDAIEEAYRMNRQVYSGDRNNIVIMITDGAFNSGSKEYLQTIASNYEKRGVIFSVVGIKTSTYINDHMRGIVEQGGGDFIEIRTVEDAQTKIINEIKRTSFRGR